MKQLPSRHISAVSGLCGVILLSALTASPLYADGTSGRNLAPLKEGVVTVFVVHKGRSIKVERDLDVAFQITPAIRSNLLLSSGSCPPFCLQPIELEVPVATVGELEIIDFMSTTMRDNQGMLVDVRGEREFNNATIPGSVHHFIRKFQGGPGDAEFDKLLESLGAKQRGEVSTVTRLLEDWGLTDTSELSKEWDFTEAKELVVWSQGPTCELSPAAIRALVDAGYPADKIRWYRGGIPHWQFWGFNTVNKARR